jgi:hypothetical protein
MSASSIVCYCTGCRIYRVFDIFVRIHTQVANRSVPPVAHPPAYPFPGVRDMKVEIPATPLELPDRSTWRYPRSSAFIGGQICFSSGPARKPKPDIAADERR